MAEKMWAGRNDASLDKRADDFNSSISVDKRMYKQDIEGSVAHAAMLASCGIISPDDAKKITAGLLDILGDIESGAVEIDSSAEDIHMFVESVLTERIGDTGKKLHTARSRNDQVALDLRMYLRDECAEVVSLIRELLSAILSQAKANKETIMPGYTHLQRAQPILFSHHILAYAEMLSRDIGRFTDAAKRMNFSPLGSCALAGTTYATDREMTARALGFDGICKNSIDGVSDRDFCIELAAAASLLMAHLSRFSEEIILWSSWEFGFVELSDSFTTGSSIMPQKKNSDMAELCRGKSGRVYGDLIALLTMIKGLPLAYNKDMQEDKEAVFDCLDTVKSCLSVFAPMVATMRTKPEKMRGAARGGFINATDLADYMVGKGIPFRDAYKTVGRLVSHCIEKKTTLEELSLTEYKTFSPVFDEGLYEAIDLTNCVKRRISSGSTSPESVEAQIKELSEYLK